MTQDKNSQLFLSLVYSFQMQAMMQMGKLKNPLTDKTEKELEAAQITIEMLDMLKEKTKGNISDDEKNFLDQVISDLKLNYVEEKNKKDETPAEKSKADESKTDESKTPEENTETKSDS